MSQVRYPHTLSHEDSRCESCCYSCHRLFATPRERRVTMRGQLVEGGNCSLIWVEMTADGRCPTSHCERVVRPSFISGTLFKNNEKWRQNSYCYSPPPQNTRLLSYIHRTTLLKCNVGHAGPSFHFYHSGLEHADVTWVFTKWNDGGNRQLEIRRHVWTFRSECPSISHMLNLTNILHKLCVFVKNADLKKKLDFQSIVFLKSQKKETKIK